MPVLHIHRAERADGLVEALRGLLADPLPDPCASEVVAVPTRGMERWLTQRIADAHTVCANVEFPSPRRLVGDAVAVASGLEPEEDPWPPERMVWPLLDIVDEAVAGPEPWAAPLARHLEQGTRRFAVVRHVADLFDRYGLYRPELLQRWADGQDEHWQAELYRRLRET